MDMEQTLRTLGDAKFEIQRLREQLAEAQPRAAAYDLLSRVLGHIPLPAQAMGVDIVWTLDRLIAALATESRVKPRESAERNQGDEALASAYNAISPAKDYDVPGTVKI